MFKISFLVSASLFLFGCGSNSTNNSEVSADNKAAKAAEARFEKSLINASGKKGKVKLPEKKVLEHIRCIDGKGSFVRHIDFFELQDLDPRKRVYRIYHSTVEKKGIKKIVFSNLMRGVKKEKQGTRAGAPQPYTAFGDVKPVQYRYEIKKTVSQPMMLVYASIDKKVNPRAKLPTSLNGLRAVKLDNLGTAKCEYVSR